MNIHVDADRDQQVDDVPGAPSWLGTRGAILCVNCDNDDGTSNTHAINNRDMADRTINGAADLNEISPLDLRKTSDLPLDQATVKLSVETSPLDMTDYIRVFDGRTAGASEIIGPRAGAEKSFREADFTDGKIELGMEALRFPSKSLGARSVDFDGKVKLHLKVEDGGGAELHSHSVELRIAPFILPSHMDVSEKIYVVEMKNGKLQDNDGYFIPALQRAVGGLLEVIPGRHSDGDRWTQDIMEIGYTALPGHQLPVVIRTARSRSRTDKFARYPERHMLGPDFGFYVTNRPTPNSSLDSFGNLECSPPVPGHPFGRIVYGEAATAGHRNMREEMRALLEGQGLQSPIKVDTGWLYVGHVDEFLSFIPDVSGSHHSTDIRGFKVAMACPRRAVEIVRDVHATTPNAPLFLDVMMNNNRTASRAAFRATYPKYGAHDTAAKVLRDTAFLRVQTEAQAILDQQRAILQRELSLADTDFIDIPILFEKGAGNQYIAHTPGSVNMLVVTKSPDDLDLIMPKPLGPVVGGTCQFEAEINRLFATNPAATVQFIDCFLSYHVWAGEIHCGTNTKRVPPARDWWG